MFNVNATNLLKSYQQYNTPGTTKVNGVIETSKGAKTGVHANNGRDPYKLSDQAQSMLERVKEKYGNMDVFVADFETDEEAREIMSRGTQEFSVLFTPDELEKMAEDEEYAQEKMQAIDDAISLSYEVEEKYGLENALNESGTSTIVKRFGISINNDGSTTLFAELEQLTEKQKERIEADRELARARKEALEQQLESTKENAEDGSKGKTAKDGKKIASKERADAWARIEEAVTEKAEEPKRAAITASNLEALLEKIDQFDWSRVYEAASVSKIDFQA